MAKNTNPIEFSPAAPCAYVWVTKKDRGYGDFQRAEDDNQNKFKITLVIPKDSEGEAWFKQLAGAHKKLGGTLTRGPFRDGDKLKEDFHGHWTVTFKSSYQPKVIDSACNQLDPSAVGPGDVVKVAFKRGVPTAVYKGLPLYLNEIMIVDKRSAYGGGGGSAFTPEEGGFVADESYKQPKAGSDEDGLVYGGSILDGHFDGDF